MDEILYTLCRHDVGIMDGYHPLPATTISEILDLPVGKVRYHLNKLRKQGLVDTFYEGGQTEDGEFNMPSWDDMCQLKEIFFDDEEEVYQIHPKKSEYVNLSSNCLHLWRPKYGTLHDLASKEING